MRIKHVPFDVDCNMWGGGKAAGVKGQSLIICVNSCAGGACFMQIPVNLFIDLCHLSWLEFKNMLLACLWILLAIHHF